MMPLTILFFSMLASVCATPSILKSTDQILDVRGNIIKRIPALPELENLQGLTQVDEDATLTTLQLVKKYGYKGERHTVVTVDGYILEMHRITGRTSNNSNKSNCKNNTVRRPIAFVMHGLMCSSASWVLSGPEKGLAFILSDAGYDVWLGNARGNVYSRKHTYSSIEEKDYWDFSWHEIGIRDLPAMIDHALEITGEEKMFYLGHSQGTTAFFVMASQLPEYQSKIQTMFAMAPIAYCGRMPSPIMQLMAKLAGTMNILFRLFGMHEFKPTDKGMRMFQDLVCAPDAITQPLCSNVLFLIAGFNRDQFNTTLLPIILGHSPAGASTKQVVHFAQLVNTGYFFWPGKFRNYDYTLTLLNLKKYGTFRPPLYDLKKIKVPISLHYGSNDWLASVKDVQKVNEDLGNCIGKFRVPHDNFNHLDFMWAIDVKELLYDKILSLMTRFRY